MPLIGTRGAASAQGFGEFAQSAAPVYIEDVFSTYLYTGTGSAQTITNGIDISGKGGLVWIKARTNPGGAIGAQHLLTDTSRGASQQLFSNLTDGQTALSALNSFGSTGFTVSAYADSNYNTATFVSWTFREQPKFFDVVTYTGNGANRTIAHNLGSVPGCIIVKRTDTTGAWQVYHRSLANTEYMVLNTNAAKATGATRWNSTTPTSTEFSLGTDTTVNANGGTYVAYLFAHDAGGFGTAGTDNVISCGSFTTDSTGLANVTLGYEPQWILYKKSATTSDWTILDTMRGMAITASNILAANTSAAEVATANLLTPNATGFTAPSAGFSSNTAYIYIAIRRGPMKTPTSGTSVYANASATIAYNNNTMPSAGSVNVVDAMLNFGTVSATMNPRIADRLSGGGVLITNSTSAQTSQYFAFDLMAGVRASTNISGATTYASGFSYFRRAPSFFDVVCYTGTGSAQTVSHNLGVVPELTLVKRRDTQTHDWQIYSASLANTEYLVLNSTAAKATGTTRWNSTTPTSSVFTVGTEATVNASGGTYLAYLFASCPGVSKVGSYSGTGGTQTISCGFAARFVLIKRTDTTGDWWVWDTARGMVAGTDPRIALNNNSGQTNNNWVYTDASGFQIVTTDASVNASGGSYIFLAVA